MDSFNAFVFELLIEDECGFALFDAEVLVDALMHFVTDFFSRSQAHHHNLDVLPGE